MSDDKTMVMTMKEVGWTAYRVQTRSSRYTLAVFPGAPGQRPVAILRGRSQSAREEMDVQDSAPLIGGRSLFAVTSSEWVGHPLEIGTVTTSPVRSVELERDATVVNAIVRSASRSGAAQDSSELTSVGVRFAARPAAPAPAPAPVASSSSSDWAPYPEDFVERIEIAARFLRRVYQQKNLVADLRKHPALLDRALVGFGECGLMLRALGTKFSE